MSNTIIKLLAVVCILSFFYYLFFLFIQIGHCFEFECFLGPVAFLAIVFTGILQVILSLLRLRKLDVLDKIFLGITVSILIIGFFIKTSNNMDGYYKKRALMTHDYLWCNHIKNREIVLDCFVQLVIITKDFSKCERLWYDYASLDHRKPTDDCYLRIATTLREPTLCENILNPSTQGLCYESLK